MAHVMNTIIYIRGLLRTCTAQRPIISVPVLLALSVQGIELGSEGSICARRDRQIQKGSPCLRIPNKQRSV